MAQSVPHDILVAALAGFKLERQRLDEKIAEVEALLGGNAQAAIVRGPSTGKRHKRSAAVRRRMAAAQKERWAKLKGKSSVEQVAAPKPTKAKRQLSAAGRKAIAEATRKRLAAKRAADAKTAKKSGD